MCLEKPPHFCGRRGCAGPQNCCRASGITSGGDRSTGRLRKSGANLPQFLCPGASAAPRWSIGAGHGFRLLMTIKSNVFCLLIQERSLRSLCIRNCGLLSLQKELWPCSPLNCHWALLHSGAPPCAGTGPPPSAISACGEPCCATFRPSAPRYDPPWPRCIRWAMTSTSFCLPEAEKAPLHLGLVSSHPERRWPSSSNTMGAFLSSARRWRWLPLAAGELGARFLRWASDIPVAVY